MSSLQYTPVDAEVSCFHCGLPVPDETRQTVRIAGIDQPMCCRGCQAVAQAIVDAGMQAYYEQRTAMPEGAAVVPDLAGLEVYDQTALQQGFVETPDPEHADVREVSLLLEGITCAACLWLNERHLARQPGVLGVDVNYATHRARVRWDAGQTRLSRLLQAVAAIGYRAHPYDARERDAMVRREQRTALWRFLVAGLSSMQVMMYAVPVYFAREGEMAADIEQLIRWASLLLTLPAILYSSAHFFRNAWRDLRIGRAGMDVPVALGIAVAFLASCWATVTGTGEVYFDSVTMFVFLLLGGRYLEMRVRHRSADALDRLGRVIPAVAERLTAWPARRDTTTTAVASLAPGDVVLVAPGAVVPADGRVIEGRSSLDESILTGESVPVPHAVGDAVTGGALNVESPLLVQVTQVGGDTVVAAIVRLLDRALSEKPQLVGDADRMASWFVVAIVLLAGATFAAWMLLEPERALWVAVSLLVATCPCALGLATPAALTAATTRLSREGVLVTRGHTLETLARVTDVVFDKTGTLTLGQLRLQSVICHAGLDSGECQAIAARLEAGSRHPVAVALLAGQDLVTGSQSLDARHTAGCGVEADLNGEHYRLGAADWVAEGCHGPSPQQLPGGAGQIVVHLASAREWLASFVLADRLRPDAEACVEQLQALGCSVHLLSGDREETVAAVAGAVGIASWRGRATPADKVAAIVALQAAGRHVLMVGDGINDAPVLAAADVSLAMGSATDVAQASADGILLSPHLERVAMAVQMGRATRSVIRQNLRWAMGYNALVIPLAAAGWVSPWLAGLGMAASSLIVVVNAMRLSRARRPETGSVWKASIS